MLVWYDLTPLEFEHQVSNLLYMIRETTLENPRLRQEIPLSDAERAAVEDGVAAHERLLAQLADVPTPAGPTPRDLGRDRGGAEPPAVPEVARARRALPVLPTRAP